MYVMCVMIQAHVNELHKARLICMGSCSTLFLQNDDRFVIQ